MLPFALFYACVHPGAEEGEGVPPSEASNSTATGDASASPSNASTNATSTKDKAGSQGNLVKVNLTAELTVLDLPLPTLARATISTEK